MEDMFGFSGGPSMSQPTGVPVSSRVTAGIGSEVAHIREPHNILLWYICELLSLLPQIMPDHKVSPRLCSIHPKSYNTKKFHLSFNHST